jgi:hypothetical protein
MPKPNGQHKLGASVLPRSGVRAASPSNYITSVGVNLSWGGDPNQVSIAVELGFAEPLDAEDAANAEQALGLFPGAYAPTANPASFTPLQLAAVCDGRWRVTNPNDKALSFRWEVENSTERGLGTVPANGQVLFSSSKGAKNLRLLVGNSLQGTLASSAQACTSLLWDVSWTPGANTLTATWAATVPQGVYTLALSTGPNNLFLVAEPWSFTFDTSGTSLEAEFGPGGGYLAIGDQVLVLAQSALEAPAQFKIETLAEAPAPLPSSFPIAQANPELVGSFRVSSTASTLLQPSVMVMPVPPANLPYTDVITEMYVWDGSRYEKEQIGDANSHFAAFISPGSVGSLSLQNVGPASPPYQYVSQYAIFRTSTTELRSQCLNQGGAWNNKYCEFPLRPVSATQDFTYKVMSFNAGNGIPAGIYGSNFYCRPYQYKLCSLADEEKARRALEAQNPAPEIVAVQEVWHNYCNYNTPQEDAIQTLDDLLTYTYGPFKPAIQFFFNFTIANTTVDRRSLSDYVCSNPGLASPGGSTQMGRIVGHTEHTIRCTIGEDRPAEGKVINGYECLALRKGSNLPTFANLNPNGDGPTRSQEQVSPRVGDPCSADTGFQLERIQINPSDATGPLGPFFEIANAHLASPADFRNGVCQGNQLSALANRVVQFNARSLVVGDFNISRSPVTVPVLNISFFTESSRVLTGPDGLVSPWGTAQESSTFRNPDNLQEGRLGRPYMWYFLSDPGQATANFSGVRVGLDHVISNFAYLAEPNQPCTRGSAGASFDHQYTLCTITGFTSQTIRFLVTEDLLDYPPPETTNPIQEPFPAMLLTQFGVSRYGVLLSYPRILSDPNDTRGFLDLAMPVGVGRMNFYNSRCVNTRPFHTTVTVPKVMPVPPPPRIPVTFQTPKGDNNWCL